MSTLTCPCGKVIAIQPEWAGKRIRCPACAAILPVPSAEAAVPAPVPSTRSCPYCCETIQAAAIKCRFCDQMLAPAGAPTRTAGPAVPPPRTDDGGVAALVVAIISWIFCSGLLSPIAWIMAASHESRCRAEGIEPSGVNTAAKILGIIGTVILFLAVAAIVAFILLGVAASAATST